MSRRIQVGRRVEVDRLSFEPQDDDVSYLGATGTVTRIYEADYIRLKVEVELDHFGYPAMFEPSELKVIP